MSIEHVVSSKFYDIPRHTTYVLEIIVKRRVKEHYYHWEAEIFYSQPLNRWIVKERESSRQTYFV